MTRSAILIREAVPEDAEALLEIWSGLTPRAVGEQGPCPVAEATSAVARVAAEADERLVVAEIEDQVVGAVHLTRAPLTPVHPELAVSISHLHVLEDFRRHGVGRALVEAAVAWAELKDSAHVLAAAAVGSRDANRFMARLGLVQLAVVRGATVAQLRARLPLEPPAAARVSVRHHRSVGQVLAHRRLLRKAQEKTR